MPHCTTQPPPESHLARSLALVNQVHALLAQLDIGLGGALARAARLAAELGTAIEAGVEAPLQPAVQAAPAPADPRAEHRRAHRPGTPPRITCNPEVEAFVLGIIEHKTYA